MILDAPVSGGPARRKLRGVGSLKKTLGADDAPNVFAGHGVGASPVRF